MFQKKIIIYISRSHLFIYFKKLTNPIKLELEQSTLFNLEEFDTEWIIKNLEPILAKYKLNNSVATLILARDLVFDKILEQEEADHKLKEIEDFKQKIPLAPNLISVKEYIQNENILLVATNKDIYTSLVSLFKNFNININFILPEVVFNNIEYTNSFLSELYKQKDLLNYGNFLQNKNSRLNNNLSNYILWLSPVILLLLIAVIFNFSSNLTIFNNNESSELINPVNDNSVQEIPQESQEADTQVNPEEIVFDKTIYEITILNGNGTPGLAGEFSSILTKDGYENVNTANATRYDYTNTIISTSNDVEEELIEQIRTLLIEEVKSFEIIQELDGENKINITIGEIQQK